MSHSRICIRSVHITRVMKNCPSLGPAGPNFDSLWLKSSSAVFLVPYRPVSGAGFFYLGSESSQTLGCMLLGAKRPLIFVILQYLASFHGLSNSQAGSLIWVRRALGYIVGKIPCISPSYDRKARPLSWVEPII